MKYKATKKQLKDNYYRIIGIGYCNAQYLLNYEQPESYCASDLYGWSCDNYNIDGVLISTGYNYINSKNIKHIDYDTLKAYEDKAAAVCNGNYDIDYKVKREIVKTILKQFINECIDNA